MISKKYRHAIEYCTLRICDSCITALPRSAVLYFGGFIGSILYKTGVYGSIARKNMEHVGYGPEEREKILKKLYRNVGRYGADFIRAQKNLPPYRTHGSEILEKAIEYGKGTIILVAHLGNWELLACIFGRKIRDINVVAKPMRNARVDRWLASRRNAVSVTTIYTDGALRKIYEVIKRNGILAILMDQYVGAQGTMVPFLGKEANTARTAAGMVHKTGCSVVPTYAVMGDDGSYDIVMSSAPELDVEGLSDDEAISSYQRIHNDILSEMIRKYPEHWFGWFHRRFKEHIYYG